MMMNAMRNLQTPMKRLSMAAALMDEARGAPAPESEPDGAGPSEALRDLRNAVGHLQVAVESTLCLGQFMTEQVLTPTPASPLPRRRSSQAITDACAVAAAAATAAAAAAAATASTTGGRGGGSDDTDASVSMHQQKGSGFAYCDVLGAVRDARAQLAALDRICDVRWVVDANKFLDVGNHIAPPRAVFFVLLTGVEQLLLAWQEVTVTLAFRNVDDCPPSDHLIAHQLEDDDEIWCNGVLEITFSVRQPRAGAQRLAVEVTAMNSMLAQVDGSCAFLAGPENEADAAADLMRCALPCAVLMNGDCHDIFDAEEITQSTRSKAIAAAACDRAAAAGQAPTSPPDIPTSPPTIKWCVPDPKALDDVRVPATTATSATFLSALPRIADSSREASEGSGDMETQTKTRLPFSEPSH